jgi:23S rRNA A2030 N6-methylase RlmJ
MTYDHHKKAGNEGDVCKHPALIAALDETVAASTVGTPFRYADLYAGYAKNQVTAGHEWPSGIGVMAGVDLFGSNRHLALWACACGLQRKPALGDIYPGSAWFAREVCNWRAKPVELSLWDVSEAAFADLQVTFPTNSRVLNSPWVSDDPAIEKADFIFIDPPDKSEWPAIRDLIRRLEPRQGTLIWLPVGANTTGKPPAEDSVSRQCRDDALRLGMSATAVRWASGGHTIGCQLIYQLVPHAVAALREAAEEVVRIARLRSGGSPKWLYHPVHYDP